MRAQLVMSEMLIGLRRNLTLSVAVIVTVAVSLALFGLGLLIRTQVNQMKGYWYDRVEVSIFLKDDVTQQQREQLQGELEAMPEVERVFYESKQQAYERFVEQFENSPAIVENVAPESLPESFRVKLHDPDEFAIISSAFRRRAGVESVLNQREVLDRFFKVLRAFQFGALLISGLQLVAAALLIFNMIRVAAFNRRRETGIMRLVGASNLYIQLPFLMEGAFAGLVGGLLAFGVVAAIMKFFVFRVIEPALGFAVFIGWESVFALLPLLVLIGVTIAVIASFVTLLRYLRV